MIDVISAAEAPFIEDGNSSTDITLVKGQARNLTCNGYGSPQPQIQWFKVI